MPTVLTPDICVIGAGAGGLTVAAAAAMFGTSVVLIEKGRMGGDCLNFGCVPSKALIAAAKLAHAMRSGAPFGIASAEPQVDFAGVARHIAATVAAIAPNDSAERFTALGVKVVRAEARFTGKRTVVAGEYEIRARRFVVAVGSLPLIPAIPGLETVDYLTNETVFSLTRKPAHMAIIGAGPVGCELAQAYRRLGCAVTLIDAGSALAREDAELAGFAVRALRADGVDLREQTTVTEAARRGRSGVRLTVSGPGGFDTVDATHLLVAAGRRPNVDRLGLDAAGIRVAEGGIAVNRRLRTSNRRVYAVGDVAAQAATQGRGTGPGGFTHLAGYHGGLVLRPLLFRLPARVRPEIVPRVTFTDPEIAQVGMTEDEARKAGVDFTILRWPHSENDRAQAERATGGLTKLVVGRRGRILGAGIAGRAAGEAIHIFALAAAKGLRVADIAGYVAPYPTFGETGKRAAVAHFSASVRHAGLRWLVRQLRRLG